MTKLVRWNNEITWISKGDLSRYIQKQHIMRYRFLENYVSGKHVLDIGCGIGYGTNFVAQRAVSTVGLDQSFEAICYAQSAYKLPALHFVEGNALHLPVRTGEQDVIISFELVEHLDNANGFLNEVRRALSKQGTFICSTPLRMPWRPLPEYHSKEFRLKEFQSLLTQEFKKTSFFGQYINLSTFAQQMFHDAKCGCVHMSRKIISAFPGGAKLCDRLRPMIRAKDLWIDLEDSSQSYVISNRIGDGFEEHKVVPLQGRQNRILSILVAVCEAD